MSLCVAIVLYCSFMMCSLKRSFSSLPEASEGHSQRLYNSQRILPGHIQRQRVIPRSMNKAVTVEQPEPNPHYLGQWNSVC